MRREEGSGVDRSGKPSDGSLFLDTGESRVPLFPFIVPMTCPHCEVVETYFVDAWDTKKGTVRMKSFEQGHTTSSAEVSEAFSEWANSIRPEET
jgi:hypothetical protein